MKPLTAASDAPDADRRPLKLVAALGVAAVALLTVFNYYGFAASTAATEQAASPKALLEHQARAEALLEEIREVLRSQELLQVVNTTSSTGAWSVAEQQLRQEQPADDNASKSSSEAAMRFPGDHDNSQMHIVFSMSCGQRNRLMQQSVLQLTAAWVGQKGPITAIMSGCSEADQAKLLKEPTFYYDFRLHFTPGYAVNPEPGYEDSYLAYNKPFGLRHFLQNAQPPVKHEIITLLDGDFYFFRPLEVNTGRNVSRYYGGSRDPAIINDTVVDGWALAQDWTNVNRGGFYEGENANGTLDKVCHGLPCGNVSVADGLEYYANIGPPYIMTLNDAKRFVDDYCHLCVVSRSVMPVWMTEMFAFSVAAANNNIKYTGLTNLGISSPGYQWGNHEYWTFVDGSIANPCEDNLAFVMPQDPPYAVHTCQYIGNFYKGKFPDTIANCDSPLFKLLPATEWSAIETDVEEHLRVLRRQEVWAKCTIIKITNRALTELKQRTCPDGFNTFRGIDAIDTKRRVQSMDMSPWTPRDPQH